MSKKPRSLTLSEPGENLNVPIQAVRKRSGTSKLFSSGGGDPIKKFMKAVSKGDLTAIRRYMTKRELSLATTDKLGRNGLHIGALHSQEKSIRLLLEFGVDPVLCDAQRWTPLHAACSVGHCDIAELFISTYEQRQILYKIINQEDMIECTPLHLACISGNPSLVRALVRCKADISLKDGNGRTPLEICISKKDTKLASALKESLEEQSKKTMKHSEDLSVAIREDKIEEIVKALMTGLNINTKTKDGQSLLFIAVCAGATDITKLFLGRGADINIQNSFGRTVLHQLVLEGYETMFKLMIKQPDIVVNSVDESGRTIIHTAAEWGRTAFLQPLLDNGIDIEAQDSEGRTPLHVCSQYGKKSFVKALLEKDSINVNARDNKKRTPLHYAAKWKRLQCMKYLIEARADVNAQDEEGTTPLHLCCSLLKYPPAVALLLENKADTCIQNNLKETSLIILSKWQRPKEMQQSEGVLLVETAGLFIEKQLYSADYKAHTDIAKMLIEQMKEEPGALDIQDKEDRTALHWAVVHRHKDVAVALIRGGADASIKDKRNGTPFAVCEQSLYPSAIRQSLLKALEARDKLVSTKTPEALAEKLCELVVANNLDEITSILKKDTKLEESLHTITNAEGQTLLHLAALHGASDICAFVTKHADFPHLSLHKRDKQGCTPLHLAAQNSHEEISRLLVSVGSDVFIKDKLQKKASECSSSSELSEYLRAVEVDSRTTRLFASMEEMDDEQVLELIKEGVNITAVDEYGSTPLIVACIKNLVEAARQLIKQGSSVEEMDENLQTPLHWAAMKGNKECIQVLLEHDASLTVFDVMEQTPLHWAVLKNQQDAAIALVKAGADLTVVNGDGETPLDCASPEIKSLLESYSLMAADGPRDPKECAEEMFQLLAQKDALPARVKELLEEGADVNAFDEHGSTFICAASIQGSYEVVKILLSHECDFTTPDSSGQTPLHWAAIKGHCSVGQLLIDSNADPNSSDIAYRTPLHWAVLQSNVEFVRVLMRSGADRHLVDEEGQTPNDLASGRIFDTMEEFSRTPRRLSAPNITEFFANSPEQVDSDVEEQGDANEDVLDNEGEVSAELKEEITQAMEGTVGELIRVAVQSAKLNNKCTDPEKAEEVITATVDLIIDRVQAQAEEILNHTFDRLDTLQ